MSQEQGRQEGPKDVAKKGSRGWRRCSRENLVMIGAVVFCLLFALGTGLAIVHNRPAAKPVRPYLSGCDVIECVTVILAVNNSIQAPLFDFAVELTQVPRSPLLSLMERANEENGLFRFSMAYFGKSLGYMVTSINGLAGNYAQNQTYWQLTNGTGHPLSVGISNFVPQDGETIQFIFTKDVSSNTTSSHA